MPKTPVTQCSWVPGLRPRCRTTAPSRRRLNRQPAKISADPPAHRPVPEGSIGRPGRGEPPVRAAPDGRPETPETALRRKKPKRVAVGIHQAVPSAEAHFEDSKDVHMFGQRCSSSVVTSGSDRCRRDVRSPSRHPSGRRLRAGVTACDRWSFGSRCGGPALSVASGSGGGVAIPDRVPIRRELSRSTRAPGKSRTGEAKTFTVLGRPDRPT